MDRNPNRNLGRNDLCWCGSNKKFKRCHFNRENQPPVDPWQVEAQLKKGFSTKECLAPESFRGDCSGTIVLAHTVPMGSSLSNISENGHVYGYKIGFAELNKTGGLILPRKIGVRKASSFYGFCGYHDKSIFSCVEDEPFIGSPEQCLVMAFRIASREYYAKKSAQSLPSLLEGADRGKNVRVQRALHQFRAYQSVGLDAGLRDINNSYTELANALCNGQHDILRSVIYYFDETFPAMFAGGFAPITDLNGTLLQDLGDPSVKSEHLFVTALGTINGSAIVISWFETESAGQILTKQLSELDTSYLPSVLLQLVVRQFENVYYSIGWYDGITQRAKKHLTALTMDGVHPFVRGGQVEIIEGLEMNLPTMTSIEPES